MKLIALILLCAGSLQAATYYVATTGNDSNDGSIGSPWLTVKKAVETISAGDIIQLRAGTYTETNWPPTWTSGSSGSRKTLMGYPGETAILRQSNNISATALIRLSDVAYWTFLDLILDNSLARTNDAGSDVVKLTAGSVGASHHIFSNLVVRSSVRGHGFLINSGSTNNLITYCQFTNITTHTQIGDSPPHAVYVQSASNTIDHCVFLGGGDRDFNIHNFSTEAIGTVVRFCAFGSDNRGIGFVRGNNCFGYNNLFTNGPNNTAMSIGDSAFPPVGCRLANNSIYGFSTGISIQRSTNSTIENNLVGASTTEGWAFSSENATNAVFRNNLLDTGFRGFDAYGKVYLADAVVTFLYTNTVGYVSPPANLQIGASSYAIGRGVTAAGFTTDYIGRTRTIPWDIGAYKFSGTTGYVTNGRAGTLSVMQ